MNCLLESPYSMALNRFGEALRRLLNERDLSQTDLAAQIGISETGLSLIINGVNKPRQKTFTRLLNRLAKTEEERRFLLDAYLDIEETRELATQPFANATAGPEEPSSPPPDEPEEDDEIDMRERTASKDPAARYLEIKSASIAFEKDVEHLLQVARIPYIHPFQSEKIACDFVTKTKTKVVIECKFNLNKDWDRLLGQCVLLRKNLPAKEVVIVIPYHNKVSALYAPDFASQGFHVETPSTLIARLKKLGV